MSSEWDSIMQSQSTTFSQKNKDTLTFEGDAEGDLLGLDGAEVRDGD